MPGHTWLDRLKLIRPFTFSFERIAFFTKLNWIWLYPFHSCFSPSTKPVRNGIDKIHQWQNKILFVCREKKEKEQWKSSLSSWGAEQSNNEPKQMTITRLDLFEYSRCFVTSLYEWITYYGILPVATSNFTWIATTRISSLQSNICECGFFIGSAGGSRVYWRWNFSVQWSNAIRYRAWVGSGARDLEDGSTKSCSVSQSSWSWIEIGSATGSTVNKERTKTFPRRRVTIIHRGGGLKRLQRSELIWNEALRLWAL